jgi:hypothetical protein
MNENKKKKEEKKEPPKAATLQPTVQAIEKPKHRMLIYTCNQYSIG